MEVSIAVKQLKSKASDTSQKMDWHSLPTLPVAPGAFPFSGPRYSTYIGLIVFYPATLSVNYGLRPFPHLSG